MGENLKEQLINAIEETRKSFDTDNPTVLSLGMNGIDIWPAAKVLMQRKNTKMMKD